MKRWLLLTICLFGAAFVRGQSAELPTFTITPGQVFDAAVHLNADGHASLQVNLSAEKRLGWGDFTTRYLDRKVQIVVDGQTLSQAVIKSRMLGGSLELPCDSPESGLALAKKLMSR